MLCNSFLNWLKQHILRSPLFTTNHSGICHLWSFVCSLTPWNQCIKTVFAKWAAILKLLSGGEYPGIYCVWWTNQSVRKVLSSCLVNTNSCIWSAVWFSCLVRVDDCCLYSCQLDSTDLIKELYKRMDASVTQPDSGDIKGDVQLALKYNHREHVLLVKVIRARDLVAKDLNGKSDPYVKLDLVPDRLVQHELNPWHIQFCSRVCTCIVGY